MPSFSDNPAPKELYEAYTEGFQGSLRNPDFLAKLLGELPSPLFGAATTKMVDGKIISLDGSGKGKVSLLYKSLQKYDPKAYTQEKQTTGDCVSHAIRNAVDTTRAVEIDIKGEAEGFVLRGATEPIYGCRGHSGQGMSCSEAAAWVNKQGGYLLRQAYPSLELDLSTYNAKTGTNWGRKGVPYPIREEARKHQVKTISLVTSVEEARDAIANGYAIAVCSNQGFHNKRDDEGFAKPKGSWSHGMVWSACDDAYRRPGFLICNSWGLWNAGPRRNDQPEGSFWIDYKVAEKMLKQRGAWVLSQFDGFPAQKIPDYSTGVL